MVNQVLTLDGNGLGATTNGSSEALSITRDGLQVIQSGDSNVFEVVDTIFATTSLDLQTVIQQEDRDFLIGTWGGSEATSANAAEPEVNAASDTADIVYIISNHNDGADIASIWQLGIASGAGASAVWEVQAFEPLPLYTTLNPRAAVVIEGQLYIAGPPTSGANLELYPYTFGGGSYGSLAYTFTPADQGSQDTVGLAYDGTYLYGLMAAGGGIDGSHIQKVHWATKQLVGRWLLADLSYNYVDPRGLAVLPSSGGDLYLSNNNNGGDAYIGIYSQPDEPLPTNLRSTIPLFEDYRVVKGVQAAPRDNSILTGIDFATGKAAFGGDARVLLSGENRGPFETTDSFSIAVTVKPASLTSGSTVLAFDLSGPSERLYISSGIWRYTLASQNISASGTGTDPVIDQEQRLILTYDHTDDRAILYARTEGGDAVIVRNKGSIPIDATPVDGMGVGAANFSGAIADGFDGEISDIAIYTDVIDPDNEPARPVSPTNPTGVTLSGIKGSIGSSDVVAKIVSTTSKTLLSPDCMT